MKKNLLDKWCDQAWLHCIYLLAVIMGCILVVGWRSWNVPAKLMCLLTIMTPLHVFEENTFPGGFFYMNNLGRKSKNPMAWPQSSLTNMITNLGAEVYFIVLFALTNHLEKAVVVLVIAFGIGEVIHHTRDGINMYKRYHKKGKKTLYGPGTITSYVGLLQMSVYGCYWLINESFTASDILIGIGLLAILMIGLLLLPLGISGRIKGTRFTFRDNGYFSKYESAQFPQNET